MENNNTNPEKSGFTAAYSPLEENVTERNYTKPNVQINDYTPIAEPIFVTPSFEELDQNFRTQLGEEDPSGSSDPRKVWGADSEPSIANPYVENLDKKEQKMASQAMVDAILDGYGSLKNYSNKLIKLDVNKIKKAINDGVIDGNIAIPIGNGQVVPLMTYVEMYNAETDGVISMSDEFKEKVSPVLLRVLMKRGIGMTDEQLLAYYFGMDIITTGAQVFALRSQNNSLIAQLKEMSENGTAPRTSPVNTTTESRSNQEPEPTPEPSQPTKPNPSGPVPPKYEYVEPEEVVIDTTKTRDTQEYTHVDVLDDLQSEPRKSAPAKKSRVVKSTAIPQFGSDAAILSHMEDLARKEAKKTTGKPTRKKK